MKNDSLLIIIPFAGGSAHSMQPFAQELSKTCDVETLELPGRGRRINEPLLLTTKAIVDDLYQKIFHKINQYKRYSVFGHSMGTLLGSLLIRKVMTHGGKSASNLFVSGRGGPGKAYDEEDRTMHLLPSAEFRAKLRLLGGSPEEVLVNDDLMEFFEPILRADFEAIYNYKHQEMSKLDVPITAFFGSDEKVTMDDMLLWEHESNGKVEIHEMKGDHFFLFNYIQPICYILSSKIKVSHLQIQS